jgi:uncharacterized LabA/DUF88 family protein
VCFKPEAPQGAFFMAKKVIYYIDGFNFYYGLKTAAEIIDKKPLSNHWKKFYWIDFVKFCSSFLNEGEQLLYVRYFTARPMNVGKRERQNTLMKVNKSLNNDLLKIIYGKYSDKEIICNASCKEKFLMPEEKQTDVNIASSMLEDYFTGICDKTVLISADSDLLPPLKVIHQMNKRVDGKHEIEVLFPPGRFSSDLYNCSFLKLKLLKSYRSYFNKALLPASVRLRDGILEIPPQWKKYLENKPDAS